MAILLQYNDQTRWTFQQLMDNTGIYKILLIIVKTVMNSSLFFYFEGISFDNMQQILGILLKTRLLEADVDESQLQPDTDISLYLGYKK